MSGPVAGAVGASRLSSELGLDLAITADVGGTSFDTCLLVRSRPRVKYEGEVVGMPLQTPWVDVRSVGAGGGSIASVERGLLRVGPHSAGAVPGPVCYGRGGTEPTVTDAAVTLGMLARETLASGLRLDVEAARAVLAELGQQLGLEAEQAAQGVLRVAAASMAGAIRAVTVEVGEDPRRAALIGYGGAGPLFTSLLARELGIEMIVIPNHAGNFSAWGLLEQDVVRSAALTIVSSLDGAGLARAEEALGRLFAQLDERGADARVAGAVAREAELDLRYPGQEYTLTVAVALDGDRIAEEPAAIGARFGEAYERNYGHRFDVGVDILAVRAIERTALPRPAPGAWAGSSDGAPAASETSTAYSFTREEWCEFDVLSRAAVAPGATFEGPAIVMEPTTTTYVDAGLHGVVHESGALILTGR
jgi:N-methylhydantoinase A